MAGDKLTLSTQGSDKEAKAPVASGAQPAANPPFKSNKTYGRITTQTAPTPKSEPAAAPGPSDLEVGALRVAGGLVGAGKSILGTAKGLLTVANNSLLQIGDILTLGLNHDSELMQQVWVDQGALGAGIVHVVTEPGQVISEIRASVNNSLAEGEALRAAGKEFDAAVVHGKLGGDIVQAVAGGASAVRSVSKLAKGAFIAKAPVKPTPPKTKTTAGEPVDIVSGEVIYEVEDFTLPGALPVRLSRVHLSGTAINSCFGPKWFSTWGQHVIVKKDEVTFHAEDGYPYAFDRPLPGKSSVHFTQRKMYLTALDKGWQVDDEQRRSLTFDILFEDRYLLGRISDRNGNQIDFHYHEGSLRRVVHSGGYRLGVEGGPRAITRILLEGGPNEAPVELVRYGYGASGNLSEVFNASGKPLTFQYDDADRMTRWQDRNGNWYSYVYDQAGRCIEGAGIDNVFANRFEYDSVTRRTTFTDSFGARTVYSYNERHLVTRIDLPDGSSRHAEWDGLGNKHLETDGNGALTRFNHDPHGNLISVINPLGQSTSIRYNDQHQPVALTDATGTEWVRQYDQRGNLVASGVEGGPTYHYTRNELGQLTRVTYPGGNSATYGHDSCGLLLWATAFAVEGSTGQLTRFERDRQGRVVRRTDALGRGTSYRYHDLGKLAQVTLSDGHTLDWDYDPENNLVLRRDANHDVWRYAYGAFDKLASVDSPQGGRTEYVYDAELRLSSVVNPLGLRYQYSYTPTGQLARETDFNGRCTSYEYDAAARLVRHTAPQGDAIDYRRNALGQLVRREGPDLLATFDYDSFGRLESARTYVRDKRDDPAQNDVGSLSQREPQSVITFERDVFGRVLRESQNGRAVCSRYDEQGQRTSRTTDCGQQSLWNYDPTGLPSGLTLADDEQFQFERDAAGRETQRRVFGQRDPASAHPPRTAGSGQAFRMEQVYDTQDRLTRQWAGGAETLADRSIAYDPTGQAIKIDDARWGEDRFAYDRAGQVTQRSTQLPVRQQGQPQEVAHERYRYDLAGNVVASVRESSSTQKATAAGNEQGAQQNLTYGGLQLRQAGDTRYSYDLAGRLTERVDGERWNRAGIKNGQGSWKYHWNSDNRLTSVITPDGDMWKYCYDALGRRLSKQGPITRIDYLWDQYTIAEEITRSTGPAGGEAEESIAIWDFAPNSFRPVSKTVIAKGKRQSYAVITDLVGMPRELVTTEGNTAWTGKTTLWGEMAEEHEHGEYGTGCKLRFPGQWHDEESGLCYNWHRYYDAETARYVSPDPIGLSGGPNAYAYVHNPLGWIDPLGLQKEGHLYRGVSSEHPEIEAARRGEAIPGNVNGTVSPEEHAAGGVAADSPYTSWTPDYKLATTNALKEGPGGVILEVPMGAPPNGATWSWGWTHVNEWHETEMLLQGPRSGATILLPKP